MRYLKISKLPFLEDDDTREKKDSANSQSDDDEDGGSAFPDTNIDIKYSEDGGMKVLARGMSESSDPKSRAVSVSEQQPQEEEVSLVKGP